MNLVRSLWTLGHWILRTSHFGDGTSRRVLPILMYHSISDDPEPGIHPYYRVCTSSRRFAAQMALLKSLGYCGVTLSEGLAWLKSPLDVESPLLKVGCSQVCASQPGVGNRKSRIGNAKPVALTFDDGFQDFDTAAFPVIQQHGFSATMYLPTAFIADTRRTFAPAAAAGRRSLVGGVESALSTGRPCLTWPEVRELHAAGIEFGSHTVNHSKLVELGWDEIEFELRHSKFDIEAQLGLPVRTLAYPYAFPQANRCFTNAFRELLQRVGYDNCVTTEVGRARAVDKSFELPRLPLNSDDDELLLTAKLSGCYDWVAWPQAAVKCIKHAVRPTRRLSSGLGVEPSTLRPPPPQAPADSAPSLTTKHP